MSSKKLLWGKLKFLGETFKREGRRLGRRSWASGGLGAVFQKELADNFGSIRFGIIFSLVGIAGNAAAFLPPRVFGGRPARGVRNLFFCAFSLSPGVLCLRLFLLFLFWVP